MRYTVINGCLSIGTVKCTEIATSSILRIGDSQCIQLGSIFETPPESLIVGVTTPLVPEVEPRVPRLPRVRRA
ncbi:spore gernimation protein GerPD [Brevibacillus fluminis]|uniref:Spore gernimation protein GerPD n=1 Tax=Brevibacillus fluminis TaxID=511487 RepID=A0A3M8DW03_9BACL|nr:spore gernimation protein GerPD [Brevibacillus fluminis]RNB91167.1 spore gernimation protein GerPD [Brevibacillus fluminis]